MHQNATNPIPLPNFVQQINKKMDENNEEEEEDGQIGEASEEHEESIPSSHERIVRIDDEEEDDEEMAMDTECESAAGVGPSSAANSFSSSQQFANEKEQLHSSMFTLSGLAPSRWAGLPILEQIRQRNRPKEAPKKEKSAPFFLPTMDTPEGFQFDKGTLEKLREEQQEGSSGGRTIAIGIRRLGPGETIQEKWHNSLMRLANKLIIKNIISLFIFRAKSKTEHCELFSQLKEMSLSALDFQIRLLNGPMELAKFLKLLITISETRREFDLVQSYLATFLNIHHEQLWTIEEEGTNNGGQEQMEEGQKALTEVKIYLISYFF
jgi:U3 small nucleolar RNA-associated protein 21